MIVRQSPPTAEEVESYNVTDEQLSKLGGGIGGLFRVAAETNLDTWKAYLTAHFLSDHASVLPGVIDNANFRALRTHSARTGRAAGALEARCERG